MWRTRRRTLSFSFNSSRGSSKGFNSWKSGLSPTKYASFSRGRQVQATLVAARWLLRDPQPLCNLPQMKRAFGNASGPSRRTHGSRAGANAPPGGEHNSSVGPFEPAVAAHRLLVGGHDWLVGLHRLPAGVHARPVGASEPLIGPDGTSVGARERPGHTNACMSKAM